MKKLLITALLGVITLLLIGCDNTENNPQRNDGEFFYTTDQLTEIKDSFLDVDVEVTQTSVKFVDNGVLKELSLNKKRIVSMFNSATGIIYEAGGSIIGRLAGNDELPEQAITDGNQHIIGDSHNSFSNELLLAAEPDLVVLSTQGDQQDTRRFLDEMGIDTITPILNSVNSYFYYLKIFSILAGENNYDDLGNQVADSIIDILSLIPNHDPRTVLLVRASSRALSGFGTNSSNGEMLSLLGTINFHGNIVSTSSIDNEAVMIANLSHIFVFQMGDATAAQKYYYDTYTPIWGINPGFANTVFLEKELYQFRPNALYPLAFLKLAQVLYPEVFNDYGL